MRRPSFARGRGASITLAALIAAVAALLPLFVTDVYTQNILVLTLMFTIIATEGHSEDHDKEHAGAAEHLPEGNIAPELAPG